MRLAVLADIHGNSFALDKVLEDIERIGVDGIVIAGDLINDGSQPVQVLRRLMSLKAWVIKGNKEERILSYHRGECADWTNSIQMASFMWTYKQLDETTIEYIKNLPEQIIIDIPGTDKIRVVHGSPYKIDELLFPDRDDKRVSEVLNSIEEKVLICGHTHYKGYKEENGKLIVNPGSVGYSHNENKFAEYCILEWENCAWKVIEREIKYDLSALEEDFIESGYLKESGAFGRAVLYSIKTGNEEIVDFVLFAYALAERKGRKAALVPDDIWKEAEALWDWKD